MSTTQYDILTNIKIGDQATNAARNITNQTTGMTGSMFKAVTGANLVANAITRAFSSATRAISNFSKELISLNQEFEDQRLALSALVNANLKYQDATGKQLSPAENLKASVGVAEEQLKQFVNAAKTAPGTAKDFSQIGQFIIDPYLKAGGQMGGDFTELIKKMLIAGQFTGQAQEVTALDAQQMLQGLAKSRDRLPKLLGLDPESINKMKPDERLKAIRDALNNVVTPDTMRLLEDSFTTIKATFYDLIDIIKRVAGNKAFESVKTTLRSLNEFLEKNEEILTSGMSGMIEIFMAAGSGLLDVVKYFASPVINLIEYLGSGSERAEDLKNRLGGSFQALIDSIDRFFGVLLGNAEMGGRNFGEVLNQVLIVFETFIDYFTLIVTAIKTPFDIFLGYLKAVASAFYMLKSGGLSSIPEAFKLMQEGFDETHQKVAKNASNAIQQIRTGPSIPSRIPGAEGSQSGVAKGKGAVPTITQNFNGGITIKQEFKDNADPDRIAFKVREVFDKLKDRPLTSNKRFSLATS